MSDTKQSAYCTLVNNTSINNEIFRLDFAWPGASQTKFAMPKAGQFFMIKPRRSAVFLARPISAALWKPDTRAFRKPTGLPNKFTVTFLIARRGRGTQELADMHPGEEAELIGPLGNAWNDFLPADGGKPIALIGGGIGLAPLVALFGEEPQRRFILHAGFKTGFASEEEKTALLGQTLLESQKIILATEDGADGHRGLITDFLEPEQYAAVCACGPEPMLKTVTAKCKNAAVPCFVSLERKMACGVGACLGCTVRTAGGNRRCCADGPIFNADEVIFDE